MRRWITCAILISTLAAFCPEAPAATGKVIKVLPHFLDLQGRHTLTPSLYDRDAYQARLREHPEQRSGIRFDVQWKSKGAAWSPLVLRVELRGIVEGDAPKEMILEEPAEGRTWFNHWTKLVLDGEDYRKFGEVTAWRATLWEGETLIGEQKSFLW
jgi:hypothetical protein